ncbi:MAG: hypothetical protein K0S35_3966 [Geminicoccaceae bacterium]|nr:hypothetical protein [Geminicoccaceae bacterium]
MGRFLLGLIAGIVVGIFAMTLNPELPEQLRVSIASLTATVMRGAEEAAESGEAVEEGAEEAGEAVEDAARETGEAVEDAVDEAERAGEPGAAGNR